MHQFFGMLSVELFRHAGVEAGSWRRWRRQGRGRLGMDSVTSWRASYLPVIMQRQVLQSCAGPVPRRWGGASASVHRQNVIFLVVNRDRHPQQFQFLDKVAFWPGLCNDRFRCLWEHFIGKVVDVPVVVTRFSGVLCGAFGHNFTHFLRARGVPLDFLTFLSTNSLCLAVSCPCAL